MIVLGIDSSTRTASVALCDGGELLAERSLPGARDLATTVLPLVEEVLGAARRRVADLDLVSVALGPGSFTGLRIGLSVAKGLALATGCAVVGVSTLEALAQVAAAAPSTEGHGLICPVLDARRGEVYGAVFRAIGGGGVERVEPDFAAVPEGFALRLARSPAGGGVALIGDGVEAYRSDWQRLLPARTELLPFAEFHPSGRCVASLGLFRLGQDGPDVASALVPRYCRVAEAEQKRLARQQAAEEVGR